MKQILSSTEMAILDREAQEQTGISGNILMENAARSAWESICCEFEDGANKKTKGQRAANARKQGWEEIRQTPHITLVIFCGTGNNGGDGLALARHAWTAAWRENILLKLYIGVVSEDREKLSSANADNLSILKHYLKSPSEQLSEDPSVKETETMPRQDLSSRAKIFSLISLSHDQDNTGHPTNLSKIIFGDTEQNCPDAGGKVFLVDALLGTGSKGSLRAPYTDIVYAINTLRQTLPESRLIALDIPTGLSTKLDKKIYEEGRVVIADRTLSFEYRKDVLYTPMGRKCSGRVEVAAVGFPPQTLPKQWQSHEKRLIEASDIERVLTPYTASDYKSSRGRVAVFGGAQGTLGAAILATRAATYTGAGLVTLWAQPDDFSMQATRLNSEMVRSMETFDPKIHLNTIDALLLGPGLDVLSAYSFGKSTLKTYTEWAQRMGNFSADKLTDQSPENTPILRPILRPILIVDAGGLDLIRIWRENEKSMYEKFMLSFRGRIFTPHIGELARLSGETLRGLLANPFPTLEEVGKTFEAIVIAKGAATLIQSLRGAVAVIEGDNPFLGIGGSGDILAGMVAALAAYHCKESSPSSVWGDQAVHSKRLFEATWSAAFLHQRIGKKLAGRNGKAFAAEDLLPEIGKTMGALLAPNDF